MKNNRILTLALVSMVVLGVPRAQAGPVQNTMHSAIDIPIAEDTTSFIGTADLNGDGLADLLTEIPARRLVGVLLSNGDGTFRNVPGPSSEVLFRLAHGDANGDGSIDLVGFAGRRLVTLAGNNDGTFGAPITSEIQALNTGSVPDAIDFADFNADGDLDVAVTRRNFDSVIVFGRGDGRFGPDAVPFDSGSGHFVDFDGDRFPDLVAADVDHRLFVMLGNGDGTFRQGEAVEVSPSVVGDVSGDGLPDLIGIRAVGNGESRVLTIQRGRGDGTFQPEVVSSAPGADYLVDDRLADFDGDGYGDFLTYAICGDAEERPCYLQIFFGSSTGIVDRREFVGVSPFLDVGDVNGDDQPDIVNFARLPVDPEVSLSLFLNATLSISDVVLDRRAPKPFRVRVTGSNFEPLSQVFVGGRATPWAPVVFKSSRKLILKGGAELESLFVPGTPVTIRIVNPDGREVSTVVVPE